MPKPLSNSHADSRARCRWGRSLALASLVLMPLTSYTVLRPTMAMSQSIQQPLPERVLSVTGQGLQSIPTTLSQVSLGVMVEAPTAQVAQQQAAQKSTAVIEWLRSQNVEKLETTGISLSPRYDYIDDRQVLKGYQASNIVSFRTPTEQAGAIMDEAVNVGATRIDRVSFVAEDEAIAAARQQALESAVQDAQQQADTVLAALGLSRQEIVNISIGSVSAPPPVPFAAEARLANQDVSTPVVGAEQTINAQVTLNIRY
ncbi:MAG: SIMPL domain-containing protein [Phormidesmis sp.]